MKKLLRIPRVIHCLEIDFADKKDLKTKAATGVIEILPLQENLGFLEISSISTELVRNTELIGNMDPYIVFFIKNGDNGKQVRTSIKHNGGKKSVWN